MTLISGLCYAGVEMDALDMFGCRQHGTREKFFILTSKVMPQLCSSCLQRGKTTWLKSKTNAPGLKYHVQRHQDSLRTSHVQWCCRRRAVLCSSPLVNVAPRPLAPASLKSSQSPTLSSGSRHRSITWSRSSADGPHRLLENRGSSALTSWQNTTLHMITESICLDSLWWAQSQKMRFKSLKLFLTPTRGEAPTHNCRTLFYNVLLFRGQKSAPCKDKCFQFTSSVSHWCFGLWIKAFCEQLFYYACELIYLLELYFLSLMKNYLFTHFFTI